MPPDAHGVLEYLAVEEPLSPADLSALAGHDAVEHAETLGAIVVDEDGVLAAHPLYVNAVRDALGGPEMRRLRTELVERLAAADPPGDVVGRLRLAVLALDSDRPQPVADVIAAAEEALRLGDLELSERFGYAALQRVRWPAGAAGAGLCAGVAGPGPRRRRRARRGRSVDAVGDRS